MFKYGKIATNLFKDIYTNPWKYRDIDVELVSLIKLAYGEIDFIAIESDPPKVHIRNESSSKILHSVYAEFLDYENREEILKKGINIARRKRGKEYVVIDNLSVPNSLLNAISHEIIENHKDSINAFAERLIESKENELKYKQHMKQIKEEDLLTSLETYFGQKLSIDNLDSKSSFHFVLNNVDSKKIANAMLNKFETRIEMENKMINNKFWNNFTNISDKHKNLITDNNNIIKMNIENGSPMSTGNMKVIELANKNDGYIVEFNDVAILDLKNIDIVNEIMADKMMELSTELSSSDFASNHFSQFIDNLEVE